MLRQSLLGEVRALLQGCLQQTHNRKIITVCYDFGLRVTRR